MIVTTGATVPAGATALRVGEPPPDVGDDHVLWQAGTFPRGADGEFAETLPEADAIAQLEDLRRGGAAYLIVPGSHSAWLAARHGLTGHVAGHYRLHADDEACRIYDLRDGPIAAFLGGILEPDDAVIVLVRTGASLRLGARPMMRVESVTEIDAADPGVRFLVVPDAPPWAPDDPQVLQLVERRYPKIATRPGVCEMFELSDG